MSEPTNPPALFLLASNGTDRFTHVKVAACETCGVLVPDDQRERHQRWHQRMDTTPERTDR